MGNPVSYPQTLPIGASLNQLTILFLQVLKSIFIIPWLQFQLLVR